MEIDKTLNPGRGKARVPPPGAISEDDRAAAPRPASPIDFRLDPASGVPTYLQLVQQVEQALRLGYLKPDDQLPKVRDVVASLAINPNTVLKAYRELETKGLTTGRPGQGTFIQATLSQIALPELTELHRSLLRWLATADAAGLDEDGIVALFTSALRDFRERASGPATECARQAATRRASRERHRNPRASPSATAARGRFAIARWPSLRGM